LFPLLLAITGQSADLSSGDEWCALGPCIHLVKSNVFSS
jgi:hypothetical protein